MRSRQAARRDGSCSMSPAQRLLNLLSLIASLGTAVFVLATEGAAQDAVHAAVPALAYATALSGSAAGAPAWLAHLAMVLNVAGVVLLSAFAVATGMGVDGSVWLAGFYVVEALLASWNVVCLSSPALDA